MLFIEKNPNLCISHQTDRNLGRSSGKIAKKREEEKLRLQET
jgi:hypothetical protein